MGQNFLVARGLSPVAAGYNHPTAHGAAGAAGPTTEATSEVMHPHPQISLLDAATVMIIIMIMMMMSVDGRPEPCVDSVHVCRSPKFGGNKLATHLM